MTFILGPAVCKNCRAHVYLTAEWRWADADGLRHVCSKQWFVRRWLTNAGWRWSKVA